MRKIVLLAIFLNGCASLPPFPEIWQCAFRKDKDAFYCQNTKTNQQLKIPLTAPSMKGAQCVNTKDFLSVQSWIRSVEQIAKERCR
jgi:hypothetical protein